MRQKGQVKLFYFLIDGKIAWFSSENRFRPRTTISLPLLKNRDVKILNLNWERKEGEKQKKNARKGAKVREEGGEEGKREKKGDRKPDFIFKTNLTLKRFR